VYSPEIGVFSSGPLLLVTKRIVRADMCERLISLVDFTGRTTHFFHAGRLHGLVGICAAGMKLAAVATRPEHEDRADEQKQIFLWERDLHAMRVSKDDQKPIRTSKPFK
jgi:hypothetical protein